jgi:hypothetical protein
MKFDIRAFVLPLIACLPLLLTGCPSSTAPTGSGPNEASQSGHEHGDGHDHDHAHNGPHGGHIIEIGDEEYHAEWTHDESGKVTVYVLDAAMKNDVPVEGETININVKLGDNAKQYTLESEGPSKFSTEDQTLVGNLEALSEAVTATLSLDINGKHYEAPITAGGHDHAHDHDHDHAHGEDHKH